MFISAQSAHTAHTRQLCVCFCVCRLHTATEGVHLQSKVEAFNIHVIYEAYFISGWGCKGVGLNHKLHV